MRVFSRLHVSDRRRRDGLSPLRTLPAVCRLAARLRDLINGITRYPRGPERETSDRPPAPSVIFYIALLF